MTDPNVVPPLTPESFYTVGQQVLLSPNWHTGGHGKQDARYVYEPVEVLPETSGLPAPVQGEAVLDDYYAHEAAGWEQLYGEAGLEQQLRFLREGRSPLHVKLYAPRYPHDDTPGSYFAFRPVAAAKSDWIIGGMVYGIPELELPALPLRPDQWDTPIIAKSNPTAPERAKRYELLNDPAADPQLVLVYSALHSRLHQTG